MRARIAAFLCLALAVPASAQVIEAKARLTNAVPLTNAADRYVETSIAVSPFKPNHLITACNHHPIGNPTRGVFYGVATEGLMTTPPFSETGFLSVPPQYPTVDNWLDPMTASSGVTDDLWVGSVVRDSTMSNHAWFAVWRNPGGTDGLELASPTAAAPTGTTYLDDKGFLSVGPAPAGGPAGEQMYLAYTRRRLPACGLVLDILMWDRWSLSAPPGQLTLHDEQNIDPPGNPTPPCDRQAVGVAPLVVRSGPDAGRLVVAYRLGTSPQFANPIEWCYHNAPQAGSASGWSDAERLVLDASANDIFGYNGSSLLGAFEAQNFPSIAADPNNPDVVYIGFAGSATAVETGHDQNVDIYIARIECGDPISTSVKRITDEMLGELVGSDQFFPVVTVDGFGGINLTYVQMDTTEAAILAGMRIMYTRMPNWNTLPTPDATLALTPYFPVPHHPNNPAQQGIDEYISIASSGCLIYVSHVECEPEFNYSTTNVYVTRLSICPADVDDNGLVELDDVAAFGAAYASQANPADVNRDGLCNASDIAAFLNAYACGCGTP